LVTAHTPPPSLRAAIARLDRDALRAVAIAYRAQRQEGRATARLMRRAVAELHGRAPDLTEQADHRPGRN
jgi:hypothetical protein